jgi:hypothetical protein
MKLHNGRKLLFAVVISLLAFSPIQVRCQCPDTAGNYLPTIIGCSHCSVTPDSAHFIRVCNEVHVTGLMRVNSTTNPGLPAQIYFTSPFAFDGSTPPYPLGAGDVFQAGVPVPPAAVTAGGGSQGNNFTLRWWPTAAFGSNIMYWISFTVH